ncbi:hypothetical protein YH63_010150 [Afipia massiliensis]|uniref:YrhK domain-containing protein n=1 Tax=Afipia massiliensis TaxID=211460 RepID=A0A4U6BMZ7_9BRAD|nr:hypothetical protein [Afipia massiliensis]TKT71749.1 hypothetical protein YH63_010150 [Afipia massiliensis]
MTSINPQEAASALSDVDAISRRVRQSVFYNHASQMLVLWGALVFAGHVASYAFPRQAQLIWIAVYVAGIGGSLIIGARDHKRSGVRTFDARMLTALLLFFAFGFLWSVGIVQLTPRQQCAFWPTYFMLAYTLVGLWLGWAFVAIGLGITALTMVGYFLIGSWFDLWMAVVNGGGLILGGLWMRRN